MVKIIIPKYTYYFSKGEYDSFYVTFNNELIFFGAVFGDFVNV